MGPRVPLSRIPIQRDTVAMDDNPEATTNLILTSSAINDASSFQKLNIDIRSIFLRILVTGLVASGTQLVRIVAALVFHDTDTAGNFGIDFDAIGSGTDSRQAYAWYPKVLALNLGTDEVASSQRVASITFSGPPTPAFRRYRGHEGLILAMQATTITGAALPAASVLNAHWEGALMVARN